MNTTSKLQANQNLTGHQTQPLTRHIINQSTKLFDAHDTDRDGYIRFDQLPELLAASFALQNLPPPSQSDVTALLIKFDKKNDQRLSKREYKRFLKELSGHKQYEKGIFSMSKIKQFLGLQPKDTAQATEKGSDLGLSVTSGNQIKVFGPQVPASITQANLDETATFQVPEHPNVIMNPPIYTPLDPSEIATSKPVTDVTNLEKTAIRTSGESQTDTPDQSRLNKTPLRNYPLSLDTIKHSRTLFDQHDSNNDGYIGVFELGGVIRSIYQTEGRQSPDAETIALLLSKYNFAKDRMLNYWEFKRMLKELAGYKTYDKSSISLFRHHQKELASTHPATHLHPPVTRSNMVNQNHPAYFVKVPDEHTPKAFPLTKEAIRDSKRIFETYDVNNTGYLSLGEIENAVRDVYQKSGQAPPSQIDIAYLIQKYDKNNTNKLSKREFKRLLKEFAGIKAYSSGVFGFFKKLHF